MFEILSDKNDFKIVRNIILRGIALVYLCAFISLFVQVQGLFGDEGIYPVHNLMLKLKEKYKDDISFINFPNLLFYSKYINSFITTISSQFINFSKEENTLHFLCLIGVIASLSILINKGLFFNKFGFLLLFLIYLTFYMVGQIFISYEWDYLLLETGFLCIFLAPLHKSFLSDISFSEETSLYLIRFLIFKYVYGTGVSKLLGDCDLWLTLNALNNLFETTPLPHNFSYILYHYSDFFKKCLSSLIFVSEIYIPFLFCNCVFRRLRIFAGVINHFLQIFYFLVGNFNFLHLLTIVLNVSNFDDHFILSVIPHKFLKNFDLDLNLISQQNPLEKSKKDENNVEPKKVQENMNKQSETSNNNPYDIREEDNDQIKEETMKNRSEIKDEEEDEIIVKPPNIDEQDSTVPKTTNYLQEVLTFFNFFCVFIIWTFHWIFPFKNLATNIFKINKSDFLYIVNNNTYMNYFMLLIFLFIVGKYVWNHIGELSEDMNVILENEKSIIYSVFRFFSKFFFKILFIIFVSLYYVGSINTFYEGIGLKLSSKLFKGGINLSFKYFNRFHVQNNYNQFKKKLPNNRQELEIKYLDLKGDWKNINFQYKPSLSGNSLSFVIPHQPRLDWQVSKSAYSKNIESDPYLVLLLGKVYEKNPVILDLLGYRVHEKENFYKLSLIDKIFPKNFFYDTPSKIKIDLYKYSFTSWEERNRNGQIWKKTFIKEYFIPVNQAQLRKVFDNYSLPRIDVNRKILISPFQMINVLDLTVTIIFIYVARNILFRK